MSKENDNIILFINDKKQSTEREGTSCQRWFYGSTNGYIKISFFKKCDCDHRITL